MLQEIENLKAEKCRILVISVPSWNSRVGSNTWLTLLASYPAELIGNLCIRDEIPDNTACKNYFSISESKVLRSIWNRTLETGQKNEVGENNPTSDTYLNEHNKRYAKMKRKRRYSLLFARELVWFAGRWKTENLNNFLDNFKPDVILHSMEGYIHLNRIIKYAIAKTGAKAIGYIWDDNFTYKQSTGLGFYIYRYFQRRSLKSLAKLTSAFFAISPQTKNEADAFFNISCKILTKPATLEQDVHTGQYAKKDSLIRLLYTGNLGIGRDSSLKLVVEALSIINQNERKMELDVYTNSQLSEEYISSVCSDFCRIHPPVPQQRVFELQKHADILLFLEALTGKDSKTARLSFSTKITDYLSSGKCIFAIGNSEVAPMLYLKENKAAAIATSEQEIIEQLTRLIEQPSLISKYADNALSCARNNHDAARIKKIFFTTIRETLDL